MASRYDDTALNYLTRTVLSLDDDPSKPWQSYPCLLWDRNHYWHGYGKVKVAGTHARAHRLAWVLMHGEIPREVLICHRCDTPACFRPVHLFAGDNSANMQDCAAKGRHVCIPKLHPELMPRAEGHGMSKLTEAVVRQIRDRYVPGKVSQAALAREFGVSQTLVGQVVLGKIWRHV